MTSTNQQVQALGRQLYGLLGSLSMVELTPATIETAPPFPMLCIAAGRLIEADLADLVEVQGRLWLRARTRRPHA